MNSVIISFAGGSFLLFSFPKQPFIELDVVNIFFFAVGCITPVNEQAC